MRTANLRILKVTSFEVFQNISSMLKFTFFTVLKAAFKPFTNMKLNKKDLFAERRKGNMMDPSNPHHSWSNHYKLRKNLMKNVISALVGT